MSRVQPPQKSRSAQLRRPLAPWTGEGHGRTCRVQFGMVLGSEASPSNAEAVSAWSEARREGGRWKAEGGPPPLVLRPSALRSSSTIHLL